MKLVCVLVLTIFSLTFLICRADAQSVTLYTAGPAGLAQGLAAGFTAKTGIKVDVYQATSGDVLARLEAEKGQPRADVVVLASWGEGLSVRDRGMVQTYKSAETSKLRPQWSDASLAAQGGAGLAIIFNSELVKKEQYPKSWFDLAAPAWKDSITMPDPTLSGSAAEFLAIFVQVHGDKAWKLFEDMARNGLVVPGPNNAALNPVLSGAKKATIAGVDYITYGQIDKGEKLAIHYPQEGTVVALRPIFVQRGAPHLKEAERLVDFMLTEDGQTAVAKNFLIPARTDIRALRPAPGEFKMLSPDWNFITKNQTDILNRFRKDIVERIVQKALTSLANSALTARAGAFSTTPSWAGAVLRLLVWGVLGLLIVYPLAMVIGAALIPSLSSEQPLHLSDLVTSRMATAWWNTLRLGAAVGLLSALLGSSAALLAVQSGRGGWIDLLMSIPFLTPPFLMSLAWSLAVGPRGYLSRFGLPGVAAENLLFSFWGMAIIMAGHYAPLVYFAMRAQIGRISASLLWAARICGAGSSRTCAAILLPLVRPALFAGGFLAFAAGIEEYGTPLVIGNRIGFPVIATEIGRLVSVFPIHLTLASALASTLLVLGGAVYFLSHLLQRGDKVASTSGARALPDLLSRPARAALWILIGLFALVIVVIPFAAMLLTSLLRLVSVGPALNNLTLANYINGLTGQPSGLRDALVTSFALAAFAAALATLVGVSAARQGAALATLALIPLATPAITMSVGFIRAWNAPWAGWLPIYGTAWIVALFYTAQYLPYAVQYARAGLAAIPPSYEWAARVHGAGTAQTLIKIVAPLLWPHSLGGAILIFSIAFRELVGSVLLRPPGTDTVATFILREFDQGTPAVGMALGMIAIAVALVGVTLARRMAPRQL